mgnify:CR=1 FL=1
MNEKKTSMKGIISLPRKEGEQKTSNTPEKLPDPVTPTRDNRPGESTCGGLSIGTKGSYNNYNNNYYNNSNNYFTNPECNKCY